MTSPQPPISGGYCAVTDLLFGDIVIASTVDQTRFIRDAHDEIDIIVSNKYVVPFNLADTTQNYLARAFLKRVNAQLATGRLLMALNQESEKERINAYANRLVRDALEALKQLVEGEFEIVGLPLRPIAGADDFKPPMLFGNKDAQSGVDSFYDVVMPLGIGLHPVRRPWGL